MTNPISSLSHPPARSRRWLVPVALMVLMLGVLPVLAFIFGDAYLQRDCTVQQLSEGEAGPTMVWSIELSQCGGHPPMRNVLMGPRGKTRALAATVSGAPVPTGVDMVSMGRFVLVLAPLGDQPARGIALPTKSTGRVTQQIVIANGALRR